MGITKRKWFWAWDFDKEEKWLNEMSADGLALSSVGFCRYVFEPSQPGEYEFRLALLDNLPATAESRNFLSFLTETGVEHIGSYFRWVYLRKKVSDGRFELYSDSTSKIKHLSRIQLLLGIPAIVNLALGSIILISVFHHTTYLTINPIFIVNIALGLLCGFGVLSLGRKKERLVREQNIFE